jgi:hypothetical protein
VSLVLVRLKRAIFRKKISSGSFLEILLKRAKIQKNPSSSPDPPPNPASSSYPLQTDLT